MVTHGSSPMTQCSTFPFLILWNHAPSQFSCSEHSWLGYLIKMHIYMMSQFNICHMSLYTIGDHSNLKHNITKLMVGPLPLAPHHDYLQYMYHVYLTQTRSKPRCYIWSLIIIFHLQKFMFKIQKVRVDMGTGNLISHKILSKLIYIGSVKLMNAI